MSFCGLCYNRRAMNLQSKVSEFNRVGQVLAKRLRHLGVETVEDLLFFFPFRYEDFERITPIGELEEGQAITVKGIIEVIANRRSSRKRKMLTEAVVTDGEEQIRVIWFGQPFITKTLKAGDEVYLSGKVSTDMLGSVLVSPSYEKARAEKTIHTARIVPMYHTTSGITHKQLRFLMRQAIEILHKHPIEDWVSEDIRKKAKLIDLHTAIQSIHFPDSAAARTKAEKRLKFDELFVLQLRAEMIRQSLKLQKAEAIEFKEKEIKEFVASLPFELTNDQKIAAWEILQDIGKDIPMNRLLEGDVGSGKTVVAALAMYNVVLLNKQAALMAPTEILAKQHFASLCEVYEETIRIALVTSSGVEFSGLQCEATSQKERRSFLIDAIKTGKVDILVGTHAILNEDVRFKNLALVIVDEQHRFGVEQRRKIREESGNSDTTPHFLSMTATPIPRSFALTLYGDLDISIIKQMPSGRKSIKTRVVDPHNRSKAYGFIGDQIKEGRQVFVICPLIEETGKDVSAEKKTVLQEYKKLSEQIFPDLRISYLHGKMKAKEKDKVMKEFAQGNIDILVSTSVVEVGVNIPNAAVMVIEGAERFGLAQLHQFRGRVGRSTHQSYCFLFSGSDSKGVQDRLRFFEHTTDGFTLAEYDLEIRGPGEVYGTSQSGMMNFRIATMRDVEVIKLARDTARSIDFESYPELKKKVEEWETKVHLE